MAIGEAGLDYHYDNSPRDAQEQGFRTHIAAARASGLPLVIHAREADDDTARILEEEAGKGAFPAVLHCYTGGPELARRALALGHFISFTGIVTFKNSADLRAIARDVPADRFLVETDAPYLAPLPYRGKRNEPAYVVEVAKVLAEVRGVTFDEICRQTHGEFLQIVRKSAASRRPRPHDADVYHSGLRLVRRRAAARHRLGRLRSGQSEEPPPPLRAAGRAPRRRTASRACWSTPGRTCASS